MKPFSENLIFADTEFSSLNPYKGELLSIGFVKYGGEELYLELEHQGEVSPWVAAHVMPLLTGPKISREAAALRIAEFIGEGKPYLITYVAEFDAPYLFKLLGVDDEKRNRNLPFHWIVLDFASLLFALGRNPASFNLNDKGNLIAELGIDAAKYRRHHALDDAQMLREAYRALFQQKTVVGLAPTSNLD